VITVYAGACGSTTEIACDDDACTTPGLGSTVTFEAACTTTYYVRLSMFGTNVGQVWTLNVAAPGFVDTDGDGTNDCFDGCPLDPLKVAAGICGCGVSDADTDGDGIVDCNDNCASIANSSQADCDLDGIGDACEIAAGAFDTNANGIPDECELGLVFNYCTAGTTSSGCNASIAAAGVPSAAASSGFTLTTSFVEGSKQGLTFYGLSGPSANPWGGGSTSFKCVNSPVQRMPAQNTGGTDGACDGTLFYDFLVHIVAHPAWLGAPLASGNVVGAQTWFRDPPAPQTTNLSDAVQWTMVP